MTSTNEDTGMRTFSAIDIRRACEARNPLDRHTPA
jgi:hypothetical protein